MQTRLRRSPSPLKIARFNGIRPTAPRAPREIISFATMTHARARICEDARTHARTHARIRGTHGRESGYHGAVIGIAL